MQNGLIKQQPISELMTMAKAFAESGMFPDTRQAAQAIVKIQAGQEIGVPPFAAMSGIHIIQGKPVIGAGVIASLVKGSDKYDYRILEQTEKVCSIDFYQGKDMIGNSRFTIEDAKKAGTKNLEKFPKNMLFARAISNGVKWFCPDVFSGPVYVPEEMQEVENKTEDVQAVYETKTHNVQQAIDRVSIKEATKQNEDIKTAIKDLLDCKSVDDLKSLKKELPEYVVKNQSFVDAANQRYREIMTPTPEQAKDIIEIIEGEFDVLVNDIRTGK